MRLSSLLVVIGIVLLVGTSVSAQYFSLPGASLYALNRPKSRVLDVSPDGKIAIAVRNDPGNAHNAIISTFDPILGTVFDTELPQFPPSDVRLVQVGASLRAVCLTSGGPRRVYLFDVSSTGELTQLSFTQLTTSGSDGGSDLAISGSSALGFASVFSDTTPGGEIVTFSLNNGSVIKRYPIPFKHAENLALNEGPNRRLLAYRDGLSLKVLNVLDPANPVEIASVTLVDNEEFSASPDDAIKFSNDGRFVFFANQFFEFAVIDLTISQIVSTISGNFRFAAIEIFEDSQRRLLALQSLPAGTGGTAALLLIDATNPSQLQIRNILTQAGGRFRFSHDGSRIYRADSDKLVAYDLPSFTTAWTQPVPGSLPVLHQIHVYGPNDEVMGAWFVEGTSTLYGTFPAFPPSVSITESASVNEGPGSVDLTVTLSAPTAHRVNIKYFTIHDTAIGGLDYENAFTTLTLQPGATSGVISIPILEDDLDEANETFKVEIAASPGIVTRAQSTIMIVDNDPPPSITITDVNTIEGNTTNTLANFQVRLSAQSGQTVTVDYATAVNTATGLDFVAANGTVTFLPGQIFNNIQVQVIGDRLSEGTENYFVNLSNATNVTISDSQGVGTISDNDAPALAFDAASQRAIAFDAVTLLREPFLITNPTYFGSDKRGRVALYCLNLILTPGLVVTAQAVDSQQVIYQLPVEFVGNVPSFSAVLPQEPFLTQIVVKLPDGIVSAGDLQVTITARSRNSNAVPVAVKP